MPSRYSELRRAPDPMHMGAPAGKPTTRDYLLPSLEGDLAWARCLAAFGEPHDHGKPSHRHLDTQRHEVSIVAEQDIEDARRGVRIALRIVVLKCGNRFHQQIEMQNAHRITADPAGLHGQLALNDIEAALPVQHGDPHIAASRPPGGYALSH